MPCIESLVKIVRSVMVYNADVFVERSVYDAVSC